MLVPAAGLGWFLTQGPTGTGGAPSTHPEDARLREQSYLFRPVGLAPSPAPGLRSTPERGVAVIPTGDLAQVIRTASLSLVMPVDTFEERFAEAQDVAERYSGFVQTSSGRERSGSIVMRVPARRFASALHDLRALGEVKVQTIRGADVTAEYIDLRARLRIAKARRAVLLGLMERAATVEQTIRVQNALDDTQVRIEELQGAISLLEDRVAFATIRLQLHEEGAALETEIRNPSIPRAFERAIAGFLGVIAGTIVGFGYLVPILVLATVAWMLVRRLRRRRAA